MESSTNETNQSEFERVCLLATSIIHTPGLPILMVLVITFCVAAIPLHVAMCCSVWKVTLFHLNLRILMSHVNCVSVWFCLACIVKFQKLLSARVNGTPCQLVMYAWVCTAEDAPRSWPSQALMYACTSVTIERLYCTVRYQKPYRGLPVLGLCLIPLCYAPPFINWLRAVPQRHYVPVCEPLLSIGQNSARSALGMHITMALISVLLVFVLHYLNQSQLTAMLDNSTTTHTLTARFQIDQSVQLTRIIAPSAVLEVITFLPNLIFLFLVVVGLQIPLETKTVLIELTNLWKVLFCLGYPLVAFVRNAHLRRGLLKLMPSPIKRLLDKMPHKSRASVAAITPKGLDGVPTGAHFEMLEQVWNDPKKSKGRQIYDH